MAPGPARRQRISAWVRRIVLLLMLGFAATVAVSWALALLVPHRNLTKRYNMVHYHDAAGNIKPVWTETLELRRPGMVRRIWITGLGSVQKGPAWAPLSPDAAVELGFRPKADRTWGDLPRELAREGSANGYGMDDARGGRGRPSGAASTPRGSTTAPRHGRSLAASACRK